MAETIAEMKNGMAIEGIALVTVKVGEKTYLVPTGSEATIKAYTDAGKENVLRKGNTLYAQSNTDDLIRGYDIELKDILMHPDLLALADGGTVVAGESGAFTSYSGPVMGVAVTKTAFEMAIYCAQHDTGNNITGYLVMTFTGCKGKSPTEMSVKDGEFFAPKYVIRTASATGEAPMTISTVAQLPAASA